MQAKTEMLAAIWSSELFERNRFTVERGILCGIQVGESKKYRSKNNVEKEACKRLSGSPYRKGYE